ncbi:hypothetical protein M2284_004480 [Rhodococcus sp. LBL1]|nr:hypothetical protein [Rhodococcus sp. LBL1]MDH6685683.1 hypothetical protein [Rhodococcus sp. LBL2]
MPEGPGRRPVRHLQVLGVTVTAVVVLWQVLPPTDE